MLKYWYKIFDKLTYYIKFTIQSLSTVQENAGEYLYSISHHCRRMQENGRVKIRKNNCKYVLSYGGGVNSTALLIFLIDNKFPLDHVVFADTGNEIPSTYNYFRYVRRYLKKYDIPFQIVRTPRKESLYDKCKRRRVIPSQMWRWCTRDFKILPIYTFYRSLKTHIFQYVGIDFDEVHRIRDSTAKYVTNLYPLIDYKIDRIQCIEIIREAKLPIPVKSGCYFCPFNSTARWSQLLKKYPDLYESARKLEENGKHMPRQTLHPLGLRVLKSDLLRKIDLPNFRIESPCGSECMT